MEDPTEETAEEIAERRRGAREEAEDLDIHGADPFQRKAAIAKGFPSDKTPGDLVTIGAWVYEVIVCSPAGNLVLMPRRPRASMATKKRRGAAAAIADARKGTNI